jgi:hypothetical protein
VKTLTVAVWVLVIAALALLAFVVVLLVSGGATQAEVRAACAHHGGVSAATGNGVRKFVACRDGFYRTVR